MYDPLQFRLEVVRPTIQHLGLWSEAAENLLVGTALQESLLTYTQQLGGGPAVGFFQMEPATYWDCWNNFLNYRPHLRQLVLTVPPGYSNSPHHDLMKTNHYLAAAMCRIRYFRAPGDLPDENDIWGLAEYWKQWYNTPLGKGHPQEFYDKYMQFVAGDTN